MPESAVGFQSFAELLRPRSEAASPLQTFPVQEEHGLVEAAFAAPEEVRVETALLRLCAVESFERARVRLLERFAQDVLARELLLAPADIDALAKRALELFKEEEPRAISVSSSALSALHLRVPVLGDDSLQAGDLVLEVREGRLESTLALRAERVIEEVLEEEKFAL